MTGYPSELGAADQERIRRWHESAYQRATAEAAGGAQTFAYLGRSILVPPGVQPITGMSHLLGEAVLAEVRPTDRVLDLGTGSGVNAILAAGTAQRSARWPAGDSTMWHHVAPSANMGSMPAELTQRDLRARSGQIMDAVAHGESFVVTRHGTPVGELIPLRRHRVVSREQFAAVSANAPMIDAARFRADADEAVESGLQDPYDH